MKIREFVARLFLTISVGCSLFSAASAEDKPLTVLKQLTLSPKEISALYQGRIVSKTLDTRNKREIAVLGATLVDVAPETVVDAVRDITKFKKGKEVLAIGKFSQYDRNEMKTLMLEDDDMSDLDDCRPQDCSLKMPADWIEKVSREKDEAKRTDLLRGLLSSYAADYANRGGKAVVEYNNKEDTLYPQKEFESILEASTYLASLSPEFYKYLKEYPSSSSAGAENFVYWSIEKFGFRPVLSMTHVSISRWLTPGASGWLIASRQIFADHYYDGSLGLTILMDRPLQDGKSRGCYLIYINRSRVDILGGFLSSLRRAIAIPRIRSGLESHMKGFKETLEDETNQR